MLPDVPVVFGLDSVLLEARVIRRYRAYMRIVLQCGEASGFFSGN